MTIKRLEELFAILKDRQIKFEKHQKKIDTKLDQITAALESFTTKLDNLTQNFVQKCSNLEKHKFNLAPIVSQDNDQPIFSNII